jgi:hypothetical protein
MKAIVVMDQVAGTARMTLGERPAPVNTTLPAPRECAARRRCEAGTTRAHCPTQLSLSNADSRMNAGETLLYPSSRW